MMFGFQAGERPHSSTRRCGSRGGAVRSQHAALGFGAQLYVRICCALQHTVVEERGKAGRLLLLVRALAVSHSWEEGGRGL
jgi:hypothetical protein